MSVTNAGSDPDLPAQALNFSLAQAPSGATINSGTGVVTWRPAIGQAGASYPFVVRLADNGVPGMSATQQFSVLVSPPVQPGIISPAIAAGNFTMNIGGDVGPDYLIYSSTNLATSYASWQLLVNTNPTILPFQFTDALIAGRLQNFYRVKLGP